MYKKLTIITINYNNLEGLKKTFESVFNQTFKDYEYIVIDGGSTDGSKEYIENYTNKFSYWVSERDNGVYNAMNKGILNAKCEYLFFLNSGDVFFDKDVLNNVINQLNEIDIVYGNVILDFGNSTELEITPSDLDFQFLMDGGINHQATFFKRKLFFNSFLYNENYKISSDWEFLVYNIIIQNASFIKINQTISIYDKFGISSSKEYFETYLNERALTKEKYFKFYIQDKEKLFIKISEKRKNDIDLISKNRIAYRLLKWFMDLILIFVKK